MRHLLLLLFTLLHTMLLGITLEEKVGQLLIVHFNGEEVNEQAKKYINELNVGGFIYYNWANGLNTPEQVQKLSSDLQSLASKRANSTPLFIAVDQEGGRVARIKFRTYPSLGNIAETGKIEFAKEVAFAMGEELSALGINLNFAPVVDIVKNSESPIGDRSFGNSPELVTTFGKVTLLGYHEAQMLTTLKHFPGLGGIEIDTHNALPLLDKSLEKLEKEELFPFATLHPFTDLIMTAHMIVPALDPDHCTTLSKKNLDYLRNNIGFQGVIISDSLVMEGVLDESKTVEEAAILALNAGVDLLLLGGKLLESDNQRELVFEDVQKIHANLVHAIKTKRISEERVEDAYRRVLKLKHHLNPTES